MLFVEMVIFYCIMKSWKAKRKDFEIMKKYISCIILIVLCVACATVFYVKANSPEGDTPTTDSTQEQTPQKPQDKPTNNNNTEAVVTIDKSGTIRSEYLSSTNLRIEWTMYKTNKDDVLYLSAELYLDTPEQITNAGSGYLSVNGEKKEYTTKTMVGTENLLTSYSAAVTYTKNMTVYFDAFLDIDSTTDSGDLLESVKAKGSVEAREDYSWIKAKNKLDLNLVSKFPELPSGDEITSLCMVLNYLKYDIDKCDLSDLYLEKGPSHYTDIFEANAGNPKDTYNSYGCMPPVIVNAANKYIGINGGGYYAQDYSGKNVDMLYYQVSQGSPVIVWACEEFDSTPSVFRTLVINGKTVYLKSNVNTLVLIGYDFDSKTVTLANPSGNIFDVDMELFEERFSQAGSYAVLIK